MSNTNDENKDPWVRLLGNQEPENKQEIKYSGFEPKKDVEKQSCSSRKCKIRIFAMITTVLLCFILVMILCFSDYTKWIRCNASDKINIQLAECALVHSLGKFNISFGRCRNPPPPWTNTHPPPL